MSVTFVHSVKTNKHIFKKFSQLGSQTILVFPYQTGWQYSDGELPNGGVECRWGKLTSRFSTNIWLCDQLITAAPWLYIAPAAGFSFAVGIGPPSATRDNQSSSPRLYSARPIKRDLVPYRSTVNRVYDSNALHYAEDNRTESNCTHW